MWSVLVVDDEEGITAVIQEALGLHGYDVQTACDGNEGIRKFKDQLFDVVITDIMMPNTDGNSVVHYIRTSSRRTTPIIGMSGTPLPLNDYRQGTLQAFPSAEPDQGCQNLSPCRRLRKDQAERE